MNKAILLILYIVLLGPQLKAQEKRNNYQPNFGLALNAGFPITSTRNEDLLGRPLGGFGFFYQSPISPYHTNRYFNRLDYTIEPGFSSVGARNENTDKRFKSNYLDLGLYLNYVPDRMSEDLRLFFGVRPSYLIYTESQIVENGSYRTLSTDPENKNSNGRTDFGLLAGVTASLGNVASIDLRYYYGLTNEINSMQYLGRPSSIEVSLKLSGVRIRDKIKGDEKLEVLDLSRRSSGTLLVMLETPDEKFLQALADAGREEDVANVMKMQEQTNKVIIQEFKKNYNFSKIAFFMDTDAKRVQKGDFEGIFVDDQLGKGANVTIDTSNYFIASFVEDISMYTHKPDYGLYVYDKNFVQLDKPYNTPQNAMGIFVGGDPLNYFRRVKTGSYAPEEFSKIIKRFNARLEYGKIPMND